jgi:hypothetical protein
LFFSISLLWCVCHDPASSCFLPSVFLGPALGKGLIISRYTFTNAAAVPSSSLS